MPKQYGGPGPRLMYPSTALSLSLARCDALAQLLFDRLVTQADDQGRMIADPDVVRGQCMPLLKEATSAKVARWLDQLEEQKMILRYEAHGHPLLQIVTWWESQNGMRRAYPSRWEAPPEWEDKVFGLPSQQSNGSGPAPQTGGKRAGKMPAQSPQHAGTEPAERGETPPPAGAVPLRAGARAPAANRTEGTYVPGTEVSPLPPSPGEPEKGDLLADYRAWLVLYSESTRITWREEKLSRDAYLARRLGGFVVPDLDAVARGIALDPWWMGRNGDGIPRCNPTTVLEHRKFQTWIALGRGEIEPGSGYHAGPAEFDAFADALEAGQTLRLAEGGSA